MDKNIRLREIPYNYTSFTDKEIIINLLGEKNWNQLNLLRKKRKTGISARMLFEILGDIWVIQRNPFIQDDLLENQKRWKALIQALHHRLDQIKNRVNSNETAMALAESTREVIGTFERWFARERKLRKKTAALLGKYTHKDNICFNGLARVSHASDASDWRVELPFVVLTPDSEKEVADLVRGCIQLGLSIIPRGGGTGYTGSAVPLYPDTVVINLEKLEKMGKVEQRTLHNGTNIPVVFTEAGVVTKRVSELADKNGLVFAVDPTSQTASTIGGNIAMNAGGKKAVLWGTSLDNLYSWKMVNPKGEWIEIQRLNHNMGKIHEADFAEFSITTLASDGKTPAGEPVILKIPGPTFRKAGLGKDVTDKYLMGLPGIQKEGCDGIITSAQFVLHTMPKVTYTFCLEFFGFDLKHSVPAITDITDYLHKNKEVKLAGLEHLDQRYIKAVKYNNKSSRPDTPKMVLLGDITSNNEKALKQSVQAIIKMARSRNAECFIAQTPESRRNFWSDRSRTAAIAAHTNAFKVNEDVVIPLKRLNEYNQGIETINIEYSIKNKIDILEAIEEYLSSDLPEAKVLRSYEHSAERASIIEQKRKSALTHLKTVKARWSSVFKSLEKPPLKSAKWLTPEEKKKIKKGDKVKDLMLRQDLRISYKKEVAQWLNELFSGSELESVRKKFAEIHKEALSGRIFVATHMHAGDGNVHTNIPVNSHNYTMMHESHEIVKRVMKLAESLDGVISGEHGIGITKYEFLDKTHKKNFENYKKQVDPDQVFNRGKLLPESELRYAYTPSLRLLEQEAIIMEQSELGDLNNEIKHCLRCGKCKPVCTTHVPRANLLYAPRNKILGTGMLIEAFLYEEQTRRGITLQHFDEFNDIADHCTVCHRCFTPCPVNIDFGDVTTMMRNILKKNKQRKPNLTASLSLSFLNINSPGAISMLRKFVFRPAFVVQRIGYGLQKTLIPVQSKIPQATNGKMSLATHITHMIKKPLPTLPAENMRSIFNMEDGRYVTIIRNPKVNEAEAEAVFFFPGCGIERLYTQVGFAVIAVLYELGIQVVLPPTYTCCGAPQAAHGDLEISAKIAAENRVAFHRVANTLNYLDIKNVVAACGTCIDQLTGYELTQIFTGSRLIDIHEYLFEKNIKLKGKNNTRYIYHDPCHTPIKGYKPVDVASGLVGKKVVLSDRCCAESGLFAVARPDISTQARFSKLESLQGNLEELTGKTHLKRNEKEEVKLVTTCPSCIQGLARYTPDTGLHATYIINEMANELIGDNWFKTSVDKIRKEGIVRVLL